MTQKKKRVRIKILPFIIVLLIGAFLYVGFYYASKLPIRNIYISGNVYLTDQEIIELAKVDDYPSFLLTTSKQIQRNLQKSGQIKQVKITKKWWGILKINVEEFNILFRRYDDDSILVLENGTEIMDSNYRYQVPKLLNYVPDFKYKKFIEVMNQVDENVKTQISEITYDPNEHDKDRFLLYMTDGNYVYLTLTKFKQVNYYEEVLKKLKGSKGILYLDSGNHFQIME